ncbi:hypothetical protein CCC_01674 [Paramagnetospirillum magnetotacticum MS-1]|uniref:Uncharacterized protein n=1 Tax=Paramagnetospirillum magnetotacticum MS-1 TaxID=272627 RepID=A0A0C2YNX7_PARME|nr:hypothetical protein CCC_01674 [Paramagnetospirillum magnetotacticum MS-1]
MADDLIHAENPCLLARRVALGLCAEAILHLDGHRCSSAESRSQINHYCQMLHSSRIVKHMANSLNCNA